MNKKKQKQTKGFTLIELLIVIAILAILATTVTLVLNPAELLRQGRDSTRISDMNTINSALALYLADVASPSFSGEQRCTVSGGTSPFTTACDTTTSSTAVSGAGWVDVDLTVVSGGSPLSRLPIDPVNSTTYFYGFSTDSSALTYEINAHMESERYKNGGDSDVESTDGGDEAAWYEVGSASGLAL
ncbi:MAG: type II secretion system protein [Candidatus Paceibacterota bacterium]